MDKIINRILSYYEKRLFWTVGVIIVSTSLSYLLISKFHINIDSLNIVANLSLAFIAINAAFLTFFITLKESKIFIRLREKYKILYKNLNYRFKHNMTIAVLLNISIFLIFLFKDNSNIYLDFFSSFVLIILIIENVVGFLYLLDISYNLIQAEKMEEKTKI